MSKIIIVKNGFYLKLEASNEMINAPVSLAKAVSEKQYFTEVVVPAKRSNRIYNSEPTVAPEKIVVEDRSTKSNLYIFGNNVDEFKSATDMAAGNDKDEAGTFLEEGVKSTPANFNEESSLTEEELSLIDNSLKQQHAVAVAEANDIKVDNEPALVSRNASAAEILTHSNTAVLGKDLPFADQSNNINATKVKSLIENEFIKETSSIEGSTVTRLDMWEDAPHVENSLPTEKDIDIAKSLSEVAQSDTKKSTTSFVAKEMSASDKGCLKKESESRILSKKAISSKRSSDVINDAVEKIRKATELLESLEREMKRADSKKMKIDKSVSRSESSAESLPRPTVEELDMAAKELVKVAIDKVLLEDQPLTAEDVPAVDNPKPAILSKDSIVDIVSTDASVANPADNAFKVVESLEQEIKDEATDIITVGEDDNAAGNGDSSIISSVAKPATYNESNVNIMVDEPGEHVVLAVPTEEELDQAAEHFVEIALRKANVTLSKPTVLHQAQEETVDSAQNKVSGTAPKSNKKASLKKFSVMAKTLQEPATFTTINIVFPSSPADIGSGHRARSANTCKSPLATNTIKNGAHTKVIDHNVSPAAPNIDNARFIAANCDGISKIVGHSIKANTDDSQVGAGNVNRNPLSPIEEDVASVEGVDEHEVMEGEKSPCDVAQENNMADGEVSMEDEFDSVTKYLIKEAIRNASIDILEEESSSQGIPSPVTETEGKAIDVMASVSVSPSSSIPDTFDDMIATAHSSIIEEPTTIPDELMPASSGSTGLIEGDEYGEAKENDTIHSTESIISGHVTLSPNNKVLIEAELDKAAKSCVEVAIHSATEDIMKEEFTTLESTDIITDKKVGRKLSAASIKQLDRVDSAAGEVNKDSFINKESSAKVLVKKSSSKHASTERVPVEPRPAIEVMGPADGSIATESDQALLTKKLSEKKLAKQLAKYGNRVRNSEPIVQIKEELIKHPSAKSSPSLNLIYDQQSLEDDDDRKSMSSIGESTDNPNIKKEAASSDEDPLTDEAVVYKDGIGQHNITKIESSTKVPSTTPKEKIDINEGSVQNNIIVKKKSLEKVLVGKLARHADRTRMSEPVVPTKEELANLKCPSIKSSPSISKKNSNAEDERETNTDNVNGSIVKRQSSEKVLAKKSAKHPSAERSMTIVEKSLAAIVPVFFTDNNESIVDEAKIDSNGSHMHEKNSIIKVESNTSTKENISLIDEEVHKEPSAASKEQLDITSKGSTQNIVEKQSSEKVLAKKVAKYYTDRNRYRVRRSEPIVPTKEENLLKSPSTQSSPSISKSTLAHQQNEDCIRNNNSSKKRRKKDSNHKMNNGNATSVEDVTDNPQSGNQEDIDGAIGKKCSVSSLAVTKDDELAAPDNGTYSLADEKSELSTGHSHDIAADVSEEQSHEAIIIGENSTQNIMKRKSSDKVLGDCVRKSESVVSAKEVIKYPSTKSSLFITSKNVDDVENKIDSSTNDEAIVMKGQSSEKVLAKRSAKHTEGKTLAVAEKSSAEKALISDNKSESDQASLNKIESTINSPAEQQSILKMESTTSSDDKREPFKEQEGLTMKRQLSEKVMTKKLKHADRVRKSEPIVPTKEELIKCPSTKSSPLAYDQHKELISDNKSESDQASLNSTINIPDEQQSILKKESIASSDDKEPSYTFKEQEGLTGVMVKKQSSEKVVTKKLKHADHVRKSEPIVPTKEELINCPSTKSSPLAYDQHSEDNVKKTRSNKKRHRKGSSTTDDKSGSDGKEHIGKTGSAGKCSVSSLAVTDDQPATIKMEPNGDDNGCSIDKAVEKEPCASKEQAIIIEGQSNQNVVNKKSSEKVLAKKLSSHADLVRKREHVASKEELIECPSTQSRSSIRSSTSSYDQQNNDHHVKKSNGKKRRKKVPSTVDVTDNPHTDDKKSATDEENCSASSLAVTKDDGLPSSKSISASKKSVAKMGSSKCSLDKKEANENPSTLKVELESPGFGTLKRQDNMLTKRLAAHDRTRRSEPIVLTREESIRCPSTKSAPAFSRRAEAPPETISCNSLIVVAEVHHDPEGIADTNVITMTLQ